jgi:hypothetical protein
LVQKAVTPVTEHDAECGQGNQVGGNFGPIPKLLIPNPWPVDVLHCDLFMLIVDVHVAKLDVKLLGGGLHGPSIPFLRGTLHRVQAAIIHQAAKAVEATVTMAPRMSAVAFFMVLVYLI